MKVLVVGAGSREHAMGHYLRQGASSSLRLYFLPGNAGTQHLGTNIPLDPLDGGRVAQWAQEEGVDLVWVGGEEPLGQGLVDHLRARGIPAFGPPKKAALLEGSKIFAKSFMARHGLPTASFRIAHTYEEAIDALKDFSSGVAVKADGLAQGKGVVVAEEPGEALPYLRAFLQEGALGEAGRRVVLEERLEGREVSLHGLLFPQGSFLLPLSRDHKRLLDGDKGPNTGGMGALAPVEENLLSLCRESIWEPLLDALQTEGLYYTGVLYVGLMMTSKGPK
ncbi:MAG: phosphoribosylamine--glycine ligase, partial [Bacillota bacterium]|nr:phosphoribosylamine--glycine ligase [Bacillota bacterium]